MVLIVVVAGIVPPGLYGVQVGLALVVAAVLSGYQGLSSLMRNQKAVRYMINPVNSVYGAAVLLVEQLPREARVLKPVGEDAQLGAGYANRQHNCLSLRTIVGCRAGYFPALPNGPGFCQPAKTYGNSDEFCTGCRH